MNASWKFATDAKADAFCREIVAEMIRLFGVSEDEAVGRINRLWQGQDIVDENDLVYHEAPAYWAHVMYFGRDSFWWITGEKRERMGLGPIVLKPYP